MPSDIIFSLTTYQQRVNTTFQIFFSHVVLTFYSVLVSHLLAIRHVLK
jgi:ABC-type proline/glycine betaine transport system permease subunit